MTGRLTRPSVRFCPRTRVAVLAALALAAGATVPAAARTQRCRSLGGKSLVSSPTIRVTDHRGRINACARPNGPVRLLASYDPGAITDSTTAEIGQVAGTWFVLHVTSSTQYGDAQTFSVFDAASGRHYVVWSYDALGGGPTPTSDLASVIIDARGAAATGIERLDGHGGVGVDIDLFASDGTAVLLDAGTREAVPPASLAFSRGVLSWTHGGAPRSVQVTHP